MKYFFSIVLLSMMYFSAFADELCVRGITPPRMKTRTEGYIFVDAPETQKVSHEKTIFGEHTHFEPIKIPHTDELLDKITVLLFGKEKSDTRRLALQGKEQNIFLYGNVLRMGIPSGKEYRIGEDTFNGYSLQELVFYHPDIFEKDYAPIEKGYELLETDNIYQNAWDEIVYTLTAKKGDAVKITLYPFHPQDVHIDWATCSQPPKSNTAKFVFADPIMDISHLQIQFPLRTSRIENDMNIERKYYVHKYLGEIDGKKGEIIGVFPYYIATFTARKDLNNERMEITYGNFTVTKGGDFVIDMLSASEKYTK